MRACFSFWPLFFPQVIQDGAVIDKRSSAVLRLYLNIALTGHVACSCAGGLEVVQGKMPALLHSKGRKQTQAKENVRQAASKDHCASL